MSKQNFIQSHSKAIVSLPMNDRPPFQREELIQGSDAIVALVQQYGDERAQGITDSQTEDHLLDLLTERLISDELFDKLSNNLNHFQQATTVPDTAEDRLRLLLRLVHMEIYGLQQLIVAAAEEIDENYEALCDEDGAGPANLLRRLNEQLGGNYPGYSAGAFRELKESKESLLDNLRSANSMLIKAGLQPPFPRPVHLR